MSTDLRTGGRAATLALAVLLGTTACAGVAPGGAATATPSATPTATPTADATTTPSAPPEATAPAPEDPDATAPAGIPAPDAPAGTTGPVEVVPTWAAVDPATGDLQVSAYVTVVEATGSCTLTMTGPDGRGATVTVEAEADASTTTCGAMSVPASRLTPGTWSGTVTYTSPTSSGSAPVTPVDVP